MEEQIKLFIKYQKVFYKKEHTGKKSLKFIEGYLSALQDISTLIEIEYNTDTSTGHPNFN